MASAEEEWLPIPGWEKFYAASSFGRIKRTGPSPSRKASKLVVGRVLAQWGHGDPAPNGSRYMQVVLCGDGTGGRRCLVHRLVALAFLGEIPAGKEVNHLNGVRSDNRAENLEIVSRVENTRHAITVLGSKRVYFRRGEGHPNAKLDDASVREIRSLFGVGVPKTKLAAVYGVGRETIAKVLKKKTWGHVR